jgi:DNA-binding NarL/FixJ family response regulator
MTGLERYFENRGLTPAQIRVSIALMSGMGTTEVAAHLGSKPKTIKAHTTAIYRKLKVTKRCDFIISIAKELQSEWPEVWAQEFIKK